jgi:hypothetical protein
MNTICDELKVYLNNPPHIEDIYRHWLEETDSQFEAEKAVYNAMTQWVEKVGAILDNHDKNEELQIWRNATYPISTEFEDEEYNKALLKSIISRFCSEKRNTSSELNIHEVVKSFKSYIERQAYKDIFVNGKPQENIARALLQAYLPKNSYREVPIRGGKADLLLFEHQEKFLFETKIWRGPEYYQQGLREIEEYIIGEDNEELRGIFYVIFDPTQTGRAEKHCKGIYSYEKLQGRSVDLVIVNLYLPTPSTK